MEQKYLLIIEDDLDLREILQSVLEMAGFRVTAIGATEDVVKTVLELKPDLMITDYILEGINGGEYCSQLKRDPRTLRVPVVILSGYGKLLDSLGHYGADLIIHKPFDNDDLCRQINGLLMASYSGLKD